MPRELVSIGALTGLQAGVYDATRKRLLRGREDMLGLVAAQLRFKVEDKQLKAGKAVWVDVSYSDILFMRNSWRALANLSDWRRNRVSIDKTRQALTQFL